MKLLLSQNELEQAVRRYVTGMISLAEGTEIVIDFKAGRGDNGFTAEVDINHLEVAAVLTGSIARSTDRQQEAAATEKAAPQTKGATTVVSEATEKKAAKQTTTEKATEEVDPEGDGKPAEVRKTTGKSIFGAGVNDDKAPTIDAKAANDDAETPAAEAGARKTLFNA